MTVYPRKVCGACHQLIELRRKRYRASKSGQWLPCNLNGSIHNCRLRRRPIYPYKPLESLSRD